MLGTVAATKFLARLALLRLWRSSAPTPTRQKFIASTVLSSSFTRLIPIVVFLLFLLANSSYLHRVPGLFGDEASEGENVYQLLQAEGITVMGERSYIGPLIDYVRTPFVLVFGYNALALGITMLGFSVATFWLAYVVLGRLFGRTAGLYGLIMMTFSPIYLTYQRLGWAITLFAFFAFLLLFFLTDKKLPIYARAAVAGLVAGLGLHNYIAWLPTLAAIMICCMLPYWRRPKNLLAWWLLPITFWAGFGSQFAVLQLFPEDQGNAREVLSLFGQRLTQLPDVLPRALSGSVYAVRYTGQEFSAPAVGLVILTLGLLVAAALLMARGRKQAWLWMFGLTLQIIFLVLIIDRFTLRYLVVFSLGSWALAGVGLASLVRQRFVSWLPVVLAVLLMLWTGQTVLSPYLKTGGSTAGFRLGDRTDTAADFVDVRGLIACVREAGPVWSDNPHIHNRLLYLSRGDKQINLPLDKNEAHFLIDYRLPGEKPGVLCTDLEHFRLVKRK